MTGTYTARRKTSNDPQNIKESIVIPLEAEKDY